MSGVEKFVDQAISVRILAVRFNRFIDDYELRFSDCGEADRALSVLQGGIAEIQVKGKPQEDGVSSSTRTLRTGMRLRVSKFQDIE
jgi:hypothetical protein